MMKKRLAAGALAVWLFLILAFMVLARTLDLEIYFVLWLIGILVTVELLAGIAATPRYQRILHLVIAAGVVLFSLVVARKILEILQQ
jgi:hypothetical protein